MRSDKGSALLSALFLMTLVAIAATAMSTRLQFDIYRTHLAIQGDKLNLASQAVGFWAMEKLINPKARFKQLDEGGRVLDYPNSLKKIYPDVIIEGALYDLQARFNLNNLQNKAFEPLFQRLLKNTIQRAEPGTLKMILGATSNWVNPYQPERGQDDYMTYYYKQKPPYLPAFQPMQSISEFRLVQGVSAPIYQTLEPFITTLPTITPINVNTASATVLKILGNGLTDTQLTELLEIRDQKGQLESKDILLLVGKFNIPAEQLSVQSDYYMSVASVRSGDLALKHYTVMHRTKNRDGQFYTQILKETISAF